MSCLKLRIVMVAICLLVSLSPSYAQDGCRYLKSRDGLTGYESGGPYALDHFRLTKGRAALREFLWTHWYGHKKGVAESKVGTVDQGVVTVLYIVQPDVKGNWGIDVAVARPMDPHCMNLYADSLVRVPIANPKDDLSQTSGPWPDDEIPQNRLANSDVAEPRTYVLVLARNGKPIRNSI
jgi:hypothetical protein